MPTQAQPDSSNGYGLKGSSAKMDEIVISGISGRFPESDNMAELKENLFAGIDMVTENERRWPKNYYGLPSRTGTLKNLSHFDATFFGVPPKQADAMDPQLKMLLESTFETIVDAGFNPDELRGSKTGVFIGVSNSAFADYLSQNCDKVKDGYGVTGTSRAMFPNRVSFFFDFKGPSFSVDTACSSSFTAFHAAVNAIRNGECEAAIVGGSSLLLKPSESLQFLKLGLLSEDGTCRSFDSSGTGYVRSEACVTLLLQKSQIARRAYASVINTGVNVDGYKETGITFPSGDMQKKLVESVYNEIGLNPIEVSYIEAHGTGTKVGDPQELNAIADFFCKERKNPLLIGSVKSNMGHSEPASGLCALAKIIISMEENKIPANLHYKNPNEDIPALSDGRFQVVDKNWNWNGGIVSVNSFGFGGANAHVILKSNPKTKLPSQVDGIPKLVCVSGRTEEAVSHYIETLEQMPRDDDFLTLVQSIHKRKITGHVFKGYSVLGSSDNLNEISEALEKKEIWYIFSGVGTQWAGMGRAYMSLKPFRNAIHCCAKALESVGIDLLYLINEGVYKDCENPITTMVCINAIQVALTDLLRELNINPDGMIGHSAGELGCAYADGTLTREQTVLASYWRGKSIEIHRPIPGLMAAVGLTWEEAIARCPNNVFAACHNAEDSVTISGDANEVEKFVEELKKENIFAKLVESNGIPFHTKFVSDAGKMLISTLGQLITDPKPRTSKWLSTSIPESEWNSELASKSSAEYHVNNMLSPVLFHEMVKKIPENSVVIEIAPHSLLLSILKRSLSKSNMIIGLVRKGIADEIGNFVSNIGKLYLAGFYPDLSVFHKATSFPVAKGTPMIGPIIKWDHSTEWPVVDWTTNERISGETVIEVNMSEEKYSYITGHTIDGRILFPATGYLTLVWKTYAKKLNKNIEDCCVVMENISFLRPTIMPKEGSVKFSINILEGSGDFELSESGSEVVTGSITSSQGLDKDGLKNLKPEKNTSKELTKSEIYKYLRLRGYDYQGIFKGIKNCDNYGINGILEWSNWITFMDTMLQFSLISMNTSQLYLPTRLLKVTIDPQKHLKFLNFKKEIPVHWYKNIRVVRSGGIEIRGMKASLAPKRTIQSQPKLEQYRFIPYNLKKEILEIDALTIALQIVLENSTSSKLFVVEAHPDKPKKFIATDIINIIESEPICAVDMTIATPNIGDVSEFIESVGKHSKKDIKKEQICENADLLVSSQLLNNETIYKNAMASIKDGGFILTFESSHQKPLNPEIISRIPVENGVYILLRKTTDYTHPEVINVNQSSFDWLADVKKSINKKEKILLVSDKEPENGIIGLYNCLKQEPGGEKFRCVYIADGKKFVPTTSLEQLKKDLVINVLKGGEWGSMRHILIKDFKRSFDVKHSYVNTLTRGDLASLSWIEGPMSFARAEHQPKKEMCTIYYAPLNFKDVMIASGKLPPDSLPGHQGELECIMGLEFAGRNSKGQRVIGMVETQAMATSVFADPIFLWPIPNKWTMEEACSIPVVYGTSYYALIVRGKMRPGESVLIHVGTGGVGQASMNIAFSMGCEVYTTVGSQQKRDFLLKNFPKLKPENIGYSRDTSFEQMIMERTNGQGVDLVLNSLSMELLQASTRCLAVHGRFLEIGKVDLANNSHLGMAILLKSITVHGILLDAIFDVNETNYEQIEVSKLIKEGIESGVVKPLPVTIFENTQIEEAFRFMASGKHIGKVVIKIKNEEETNVVISKPTSLPAVIRTYFNPDKSYILLGGLGGFGLELTQWMFTRGAKYIVLVSRSGVTTGYQTLCIRNWCEKGYKVIISQTDATTKEGAKKLINETNTLAPVGGIFNLAAVLKDGYIENQTIENFKIVCQSKVDATKALDFISRSHCPQLDYFVVFSSVACGRGNAGQTNYAMANSCMERICEKRQADGLPGTAIQWGAVGDVGLVIESFKADNETIVGGTLPQRISSCIKTMDTFLQYPYPIMSSIVLADRRKQIKTTTIDIVDAVANILGIKNAKKISNSTTLSDLGMDSLMGAEIKQTLERNCDLIMSPSEIRSLTFEKIKQLSQGGQENGSKEINKIENSSVSYRQDKLMPTQALIKMKQSSKGDKRLLFFIHAVEGNVASLSELAKLTSENDEVYGLQCTKEAPLESIKILASYYISLIKKVQPKGPFRIVGYSFGALVAIEIGLQLEEKKDQVQLTLLDGSHTFFKMHIKHYRNNLDLKSEEAVILAYFVSLFDQKDSTEIQAKLNSLSTTKERMDRIGLILSEIIPYKEDDINMALASFNDKLLASEKYIPDKKFKGDVTLIRSTDTFVDAGDDYGLSDVCSGQLKILQLQGTTHRSILQKKGAEIIAEILKN